MGTKQKLIIMDYRQLPKGPCVTLECERGDDFMAQAKDLVRKSGKFEVQEEEGISFCCYVIGSDHRFEFNVSEGYWNATPISCIYFWTEPKPVSPEKAYTLHERIAMLERYTRHLQAASSSAREQLNRWADAGTIHVEQVERMFPKPCEVNMSEVGKELEAKRSSKEKGVQELWAAVMKLIPVRGIVKNCTKPYGIQFAGRSHDIDLALMVRDVLAMEYLDTPIELKQQITSDAGRREVVLQLLDRMKFVFDAQPARDVCYGVGLDAQGVLFVKCERSLDYAVTPTSPLWGKHGVAQVLFSFLGSSPVTRGYVPVELPELWQTQAEGLLSKQGSGCAVFRLSIGCAAKVGGQEFIEHELGMIRFVKARCKGLVCPVLLDADLNTANPTWPFGFQMELHNVVSVGSEAELCSLLSDVFWKLGVLHALGVVHNDVKPSNVLRTTAGEHLLCDFGNAVTWSNGDAMPAQRGATEYFKVVPGAFDGSEESMFACDMECLFWTVLSLWLKVIRRRDTEPHLSFMERLNSMTLLGAEGGLRIGNSPQLVSPQTSLLKSYFKQVSGNRKLWQPLDLFHQFLELKRDGNKNDWIASVASFEEEKELPVCSESILSWVWDNLREEKE